MNLDAFVVSCVTSLFLLVTCRNFSFNLVQKHQYLFLYTVCDYTAPDDQYCASHNTSDVNTMLWVCVNCVEVIYHTYGSRCI